MSVRRVIFNADDFGYSSGINRGIVEAHVNGVVTSASLMVHGHATREASQLAGAHPELAVGLHFDVWGEDEREFDIDDVPAVREEFARQLELFERLIGRLPTHVDSHRHAHRKPGMSAVFRELVEPLGVPLRDDGRVRFVGDFYAQWTWMVTELEKIGVPALQAILREKVGDGWTELSCHPGYPSPEYREGIYLAERSVEVATLTAPAIRATLDELGLVLCSYADYTELAAR